MRSALEQAKRAREFILDKMGETISESREQLAAHAPRITTISIDPEQIVIAEYDELCMPHPIQAPAPA